VSSASTVPDLRTPALPALATLNTMPSPDFAAALGPLFEHAPGFLVRLADRRPFATWDALFEDALGVALAMPEPDQVELLDSHVRLGADPATTRARSELSYREQGYDRSAAAGSNAGSDAAGSGEGDRSAEEGRVAAELARLNDAYEARFGFRYVVFVAGRTRAELLPGMAAALEADRDTERERGLRDVVAIARDRCTTLVAERGTEQ
jgi:2-oxo-4-hydroxy-4-carboxy-5-ureidoimidazoline decarboxylase